MGLMGLEQSNEWSNIFDCALTSVIIKYYSKSIVYFKSVEENKNGTNDCEMKTDKTQFKEREGRGCYHQRKQRDQERLIHPMVPQTHGLTHSIRTETQTQHLS